MVCSISSVPSAISECVFCSTNQVTPAEFIPLPTMEIRFAAKISRMSAMLEDVTHVYSL